MLKPVTLIHRRAMVIAGALVSGLVVLWPWWRNHDALRDFYDYGLVVAAAGRINAGERPYVDFLTPIQTLQLGLAAWTERLLGAQYLSLTYANGLFIGAALVGLWLLLRRPLGHWTAWLVATAVVCASSGQHTIIWHNAMGVTWTAMVIWASAQLPAHPARTKWWLLICLGLWLGGMTKLTYQVASLAFAVLFIGRATITGTIGRREGIVGACLCFLSATVLPLASELAYTGATFQQWVHNVWYLARSRTALLGQLASLKFYLATPHDYYRPMYLPFVGAWGLALLLVTVGLCRRGRRIRARVTAGDGWMLGLAAVGAVMCGGVLLATNFDIAYLSAAAWLVLAVGLLLAFSRETDGRIGRAARWWLAGASASLLAPAWVSTWQGARALWGVDPLVRANLVSADQLPARFAYLHGLMITRPWLESLNGFDEYERGTRADGFGPGDYYFVNGAEWMVRALPGATHAGLPLWLHHGTTFSHADVWRITDRLNRGSPIPIVISDDPWNHWFSGMGAFIGENYRAGRIGPELHVYRWRTNLADPLAHPVDFATMLDSNLLLSTLSFAGAKPSFRYRADGGYLGSSESWSVALRNTPSKIRVEMVAELRPEAIGREVPVVFRVRESKSGNPSRMLFEERATLSAKSHEFVKSFSSETSSAELTFEVELQAGSPAVAGWRALQASGGQSGRDMPGPLDATLPRRETTEGWWPALFTEGRSRVEELAGFSIDIRAEHTAAGPELFTHAPGELWLKVSPKATRLSGRFGLREASWTNPNSFVGARVAIVHSQGGRIEVMAQRELRPRREADRAEQTFDVAIPAGGGWIGLVFTTLEGNSNAYGHLWWRDFRLGDRGNAAAGH